MVKNCSRCKKSLDISLFYNKASACKKCEKARRKEIYDPIKAHNSYIRNLTEEKKEKRRIYSRNKRNEDIEKARNRLREWRKANPDYKKFRWKNDLMYRLKENLRGRIYKALINNSKSSSTIELLGCTIHDYKKYIESLFLENMSWDNYGNWHIDHIIPISSFNLENVEEQKICFNYKNTQPLWAIDNLKKSNKHE